MNDCFPQKLRQCCLFNRVEVQFRGDYANNKVIPYFKLKATKPVHDR